MAFYTISGIGSGIIEDVFVVETNEAFCFSGATLKDYWYVPNLVPPVRYFALEPNTGIGVFPKKVVLLVDGNEKVSVEGDFSHLFNPQDSPLPTEAAAYRLQQDPHCWSSWQQIKTILETRAVCSGNAEKILSVMTDWENISEQTTQQVRGIIEKTRLSPNDTEILVAGTQWLFRHRSEGIIMTGNAKVVWGQTLCPLSNLVIKRASPIRKGWFVELPHEAKQMLRWNGYGIETLFIAFPSGEWERHESWVFWNWEHMLLTPAGRLVTIPRNFGLQGISQWWAFFLSPDRRLAVVDYSGNLHYERLPQQYGRAPTICVGNESVLLACRDSKYRRFFIANSYDWPFRRSQREMIAYPYFVQDRVFVIKGKPDIFVIVFWPNSQGGPGICLVDAMGRSWRSPITLEHPDSNQVDCVDLQGNKIVLRSSASPGHSIEFSVFVKNAKVHIDTSTGIVFEGKMTLLPKQRWALKNLLSPLFDA